MLKKGKRKQSEHDYFEKTFSNLAIVTHESYQPKFNSCFRLR